MFEYKWIKYIIITIALVLGIGYLVLKYPTSLNKTYTGLKYQLGEENTDKVEEITVTFDGKIIKDFWLNKKFVGKIDIQNIEDLLQNTEKAKELKNIEVKLDLKKDMSAYFDYKWVENGKPDGEFIGIIYFDNLFRAFTIQVCNPDWNVSDGLMITAPITCRTDALELSNKLMKNRLYYNGEYFKLK